jgi:hypothetical protein
LGLVERDRSTSSSSGAAAALIIPHPAPSEPPTPRSHTATDQLPSPTKKRRIEGAPLQYSTYYHCSPDATSSILAPSPHASVHSGPSPTPSGAFASRRSARLSDDHGSFSSDFLSRHASFGSNGPPLSPRFWRQQPAWPQVDLQEACLMRYWVENLARWVWHQLSHPC